MKIMLAQLTASALAGHESYREALGATLQGAGHKVQMLDLAPIAARDRAITNLASLRLMGTAASADVLICLDAAATVLCHPRKLALLLDVTYLSENEKDLPHDGESTRQYVANVLLSSLNESTRIFVPSLFAQKRLRARGIGRCERISPEFPSALFDYPRHRGPELLVLNDVNDRQRPELLIACLAALPEPFRARWIAPRAESATLARLLDLVREAGVEQRFAVEVRTIDRGERSFMLSQAAACLDLAPGLIAAGENAHEALRLGVPLIICADSGALQELSGRSGMTPPSADGMSLAEAVRASHDQPIEAPRGTSSAQSVAKSWAPLLKALSK